MLVKASDLSWMLSKRYLMKLVLILKLHAIPLKEMIAETLWVHLINV